MCYLLENSPINLFYAGFSDDNNYLKNTIAEEAHLDCFGELPAEKVILADGTDATDEVLKAERWLIEHSF